jgi:hypothetical protein
MHYADDDVCIMRRTLHSQDHTHSHTHALTLNCAQGPSLLEEFELLEQQKLQEDYWNQQHQKKYEQLRGFVQQRKHKQTQSSVRQSVLSEKQQHQQQPEELLQQGQLSLQLRHFEEDLNSRFSPRQVSSAHITIYVSSAHSYSVSSLRIMMCHQLIVL